MVDLEVPAYLFHWLLQPIIYPKGGVESDGPLIFAGGLIKVEIYAGIVDFFLDAVPFGEVEQVLRRNGKKEVDVFLSLLFIIEHKRPHLQPTNRLQDVHDRIKLNRKRIQIAIILVYGLHLQIFVLLVI